MGAAGELDAQLEALAARKSGAGDATRDFGRNGGGTLTTRPSSCLLVSLGPIVHASPEDAHWEVVVDVAINAHHGLLASSELDRGDHLKRTVYMLPTLEDDGLKVRDYPQHHDIITPDSRLPRLEVPEFLMKDLADALSGREVDAEDVAAESAERLRAAIAQS